MRSSQTKIMKDTGNKMNPILESKPTIGKEINIGRLHILEINTWTTCTGSVEHQRQIYFKGS